MDEQKQTQETTQNSGQDAGSQTATNETEKRLLTQEHVNNIVEKRLQQERERQAKEKDRAVQEASKTLEERLLALERENRTANLRLQAIELLADKKLDKRLLAVIDFDSISDAQALVDKITLLEDVFTSIKQTEATQAKVISTNARDGVRNDTPEATLTAEEIAHCKRYGLDEKIYLRNKKEALMRAKNKE